MVTIRCLIIDDEPLARKGLEEFVADVDFLELRGVFSDPLKALPAIEAKQIDLLFLDIQMPKITGIDFFRTLKNPPLVIFTTAYPSYALEGFEVNALDYLVKPISFDRFFKACIRAREKFLASSLGTTNATSKNEESYFFIKADNAIVKILFDDILYIEGLQNYVAIHTKEKKFVSYLTFKSIEDYLPSKKFIKTHKSYIVAANYVESIEGNFLRVGGAEIPISRSLKEIVLEKLLSGRFLKR